MCGGRQQNVHCTYSGLMIFAGEAVSNCLRIVFSKLGKSHNPGFVFQSYCLFWSGNSPSFVNPIRISKKHRAESSDLLYLHYEKQFFEISFVFDTAGSYVTFLQREHWNLIQSFILCHCYGRQLQTWILHAFLCDRRGGWRVRMGIGIERTMAPGGGFIPQPRWAQHMAAAQIPQSYQGDGCDDLLGP